MSSLTFSASELASLFNSYAISEGPPFTIVVPQASKLVDLQDITVSGTLLKKQFVTLDRRTNQRSVKLGTNDGHYTTQSADGDLHFCLGGQQLQPHIACELQNAKLFIPMFNQAIGQRIAVSGFFRCMFEHPGFRVNDDAHIFEIHPVRAATIGQAIHAFDVDVPDQASIHTWTTPHPLNEQDNQIKVTYDITKDTLTFSGMEGTDENYVVVSGTISSVSIPPAGGSPASFIFTSNEIGHPIQAYALQGTTALRQLQFLREENIVEVSMVALRNIDLL